MDLSTIAIYLTPLLQGSVWTLALFFLSGALAVMLGMVTCAARMSSNPVIRNSAKLYIEIIRGTPLLVQLFFIYYGLPQAGIILNGFVAGVLGLTLNYGAYLAELFRSGIQSIESGQYEAGRSLGISPLQRLKVIILPQAVRNIFPALGNYGLVLIKDTSLVAIISVEELMRSGQMLASSTFQSLLVYSLVGVIYFLISSVISYAFRRGERLLTVPGYWDGSSESSDFSKV